MLSNIALGECYQILRKAVVGLPKMVVIVWSLKEYEKSGNFPVEKWYLRLPPQDQAAIDSFLDATRNFSHLRYPHYGHYDLGRNKKKLLEARCWSSKGKRQYRIFCDTSPGYTLIFLCGCFHQDDQYTPANAPGTADTRRTEIEKGEASASELRF